MKPATEEVFGRFASFSPAPEETRRRDAASPQRLLRPAFVAAQQDLQARASRGARNSGRSPPPSTTVSDAPIRACFKDHFCPFCSVFVQEEAQDAFGQGQEAQEARGEPPRGHREGPGKEGHPAYGPPNGAAQMAGNYAVGRVMKKRGASNGIPDIMIYRRGVNGETGLAIELKNARPACVV
jgi:hypothetical protein